MALSPQPTEADLRSLISDAVAEGTIVDYKGILRVNTDEERKEFLADVSSFANTIGGHLIIGMEEQKGVPTDLPGVQVDNADELKLRLEQIIQNGIAPRIPRVSIQLMLLENGNSAIVIYVSQSLAAPHMVTFKGSSRFFARNSAGKYQLDVQQIRRSFLISESIEQNIRDFRLDRIARLGASDMPVSLVDYPKIAVHYVPLASYQVPQVFDISKIPHDYQRHAQPYRLNQYRFNLDGVLFYTEYLDKRIVEYLQVFRNGIFEFVTADIISPQDFGDKKPLDFHAARFELVLINRTYHLLSFQRSICIEPPIIIFISLVGVGGLKLRTGEHYTYPHEDVPIDRDVLQIPEVLLEAFPSTMDEIPRLLKPTFDAVWNSAGRPASQNYSDDGAYRLKLE